MSSQPTRRTADSAWLRALPTARTDHLRSLALVANLVVAALIGLAPVLSARPQDERGQYWATAAVIAVAAGLLLAPRLTSPLVVLLAIGVPTLATLHLLATTTIAGMLPMLLIWSAMTTAYFGTRVSTLANLGVLGVGMAVVVVVSDDPAMSELGWLVVMVVCSTCSATVRLIAERGDAVLRQLDDRTRQDALTGLLNRRGFDSALERLWSQPASPFSVIMFDLDHFKRVNDTYGHGVGDHALQAFAEVLHKEVRAGDVVARTGGEEFGLLLPGRDDTAALARAEVVVERFAAHRITHTDGVLRCTVSAGVATRGEHHESASQLCRDADRALYAAKETGRNRAVLHTR